jgi:hypothetical protein
MSRAEEIKKQLRDFGNSNKAAFVNNARVELLSFELRNHLWILKLKIDGQEQTFDYTDQKIQIFLDSLIYRHIEEVKEEFAEAEKKQIQEQVKADKIEIVKDRPNPLQHHSSAFKKLNEILMEDIEKVRNNKEYIQQAQTVSKSAQTIINMAKLELDVYKTSLDL